MLGGESMTAREYIQLVAAILEKTEEQVLREIDRKVKRAVKNPPKRDKEFWEQVAPNGVIPSPERAVEIFIEIADERR